MDRDTSEKERDRQSHLQRHGCSGAAKRSATATSSKEEAAKRMNERQTEKEIRSRVLARAAAVTAAAEDRAEHTRIAVLHGAEADEAMRTMPTRRVPVILEGPHEAAPSFHEDWTIVPGSSWDAEKREQELRLRDARNRLIREYLTEGRAVFYRSSGDSMWPLVQSDDAITLHPIQAVTARDGIHAIQKEASEIGVGDVVFCIVQHSRQYYAHIVLDVEWSYYHRESKYWIGNIRGHYNGWCLREHIFGILVDVQKWHDGQYYSRPHPKTMFAEVKLLVKENRWCHRASRLCDVWPEVS